MTGCKFQKWHRKGGNKIKMHANEHCQLKWKSNEVKFLRNAFSMCFVCSDSKFVWKHVRTRCSSAIPISIETESTASDALIACNEKKFTCKKLLSYIRLNIAADCCVCIFPFFNSYLIHSRYIKNEKE